MSIEKKMANLKQEDHVDEEDLKYVNSTTAHAASPEEHYPDGGSRAWSTVAAGFLSFIATIGFLSGGSVFQSYFMTTILSTSSADDIAWIGSVQIWGCFFFGMLSGRLSDNYGPKYLLGVGGFFLVLGNMMSSISSKYWHFLLSQGFCVAFGMGLAFTPALAIQSQWFLKRRGFVVGLVMSGQNVGGVIWPVLANELLNKRQMSYGWVLRIIAFMQLALMAVATLLVQARFPRSLSHDPVFIKTYITDKRTTLFTLGLLILNFGIYVPWFFITPYAWQFGASPSLAFYEAAVLNAGAFFGCYVCGIVADFGLGFFNALTATTLACTAAAFGWIGTRSTAGITVWTVVYGFLSGAIQTIFSPCISMLAPRPELIGSWNGICITISSFAVLGTGPIAGRMLTSTGGVNYLPMQLYTGACLLAASILLIITRLWVSRALVI